MMLAVHPLDDVPERKVDTSALGPMPTTHSVRFSLLSLRAYLIPMILLVAYHVVMLARYGDFALPCSEGVMLPF